MALTKVGTDGIKDDAVTSDKVANAINSSIAANTAKDLTALSASNLTSGTIPDARFPATLPAASAANLTAVPAANITGTLPAISGANLTSLPAANLTGALPAISGANLTGLSSGLAMSDLWRLDTGFSGGQVPITANWSRPSGGNNDLDTYGTLGTGMTQSSGVFTFPSTGIYTIFFAAGWYYTSDSSNLAAYITVTYDNGSNWTRAASGKTSIPDYSSFNVYQQTSCWHQMDVTDTSNRKVRFEIETHHSPNLEGTNAENRTYVLFQKLGDT